MEVKSSYSLFRPWVNKFRSTKVEITQDGTIFAHIRPIRMQQKLSCWWKHLILPFPAPVGTASVTAHLNYSKRLASFTSASSFLIG
jgi:hypothetical protein